MVFLINASRVVFAPLLSEFIGHFGMTTAAAGTVVTLVWVGSAAPRVPTGWLLTRYSRLTVVLSTGAVLTAASAFTATAGSVPALAAGALSMGLASGAYFVSANPLLSELFPSSVGRVMGIHGTASQFAAVAAAPAVTLAVAVGDRWLPVAGWQLVFVAVGLLAAGVTALVLVAGRRTDLPDAGGADRDLLGAVRREWRTVLLGVVILGTTGFVWQGVFNFYELYMVQKGVADATAKNLITVVFAAGIPAFLVSGRLADRFPHVPYILTVLAAFIAGLFALTAVGGLVGIVAVSLYVGVVIHSLFPAMDAYLLDTLPDDSRGSAYAVYSGSMMLTQSVGASVVGTLRDLGLRYATVFRSFAAGLAVVVAGLVVLQRLDRLPE
ncbi:MAG: MFS transporter [Halolamina sp.]